MVEKQYTKVSTELGIGGPSCLMNNSHQQAHRQVVQKAPAQPWHPTTISSDHKPCRLTMTEPDEQFTSVVAKGSLRGSEALESVDLQVTQPTRRRRISWPGTTAGEIAPEVKKRLTSGWTSAYSPRTQSKTVKTISREISPECLQGKQLEAICSQVEGNALWVAGRKHL